MVARLREINVTPHVAQNDTNRSSAIDDRTTRHAGYEISQRKRKRVEDYGSSGNGSIHHISMETIKASLGLDITHIPYRGAAQTAAGLMTGEISMMLSAYNNVTPVVESGKAKVIAITTAHRSAQEPDVQAVSERIPGYDFSTKLGIVAPAGTPPEIIAIASKQIQDALKYAQTVPRLASVFKGVDFNIVGSTPEFYAKDIKSDYNRFSEAVRISGAKSAR